MTTLIETAASDGEKAMTREVKAAEKDREKNAEAANPSDGGVLAVALSSDKVSASIEELKEKAFEKLRRDTSNWIKDVIADAVAYAKENSPRDKESLDRALHKTNGSPQPLKESEIATMFATSVWPSLKSRGWKAEVLTEGDSVGKTRYSFDGKDVSPLLSLLRPAPSLIDLSVRLIFYLSSFYLAVLFDRFGFENCVTSLPRTAECDRDNHVIGG